MQQRRTQVVFYRETSGRVPTLDWLSELPPKAQARCRALIERLQTFGHRLRHPHSHVLRDGIYELRTRIGTVRYRMLYFWHGNVAAVISHGIVKKSAAVPTREIERAIRRRREFERNPQHHTQELEQ
jgi:phage-related protein